MHTRHAASTVIGAPMDRIFQLLAEPSEHHRFDASGMVGLPETTHRLTSVGQLFVMSMTYRSGGHMEHYRSDNYVTALVEPRVIEWATATHDGPLLGWFWRYELDPAYTGTRVTLIYDWSATPRENVDRFGVPLIDEGGLRTSLALLTQASEVHPR